MFHDGLVSEWVEGRNLGGKKLEEDLTLTNYNKLHWLRKYIKTYSIPTKYITQDNLFPKKTQFIPKYILIKTIYIHL